MIDPSPHHYSDPTRETNLTMPFLSRIEIASLLDVESHQVNRLHQTTSHVIRFTGGGTFTVVHDASGGPVEMKARNLILATNESGVVTLFGTHQADGCALGGN